MSQMIEEQRSDFVDAFIMQKGDFLGLDPKAAHEAFLKEQTLKDFREEVCANVLNRAFSDVKDPPIPVSNGGTGSLLDSSIHLKLTHNLFPGFFTKKSSPTKPRITN